MEDHLSKFYELVDKSTRLAEAMNNIPMESAEVNELYASYAKFCATPVSIERSGNNSFQKYKYAKVEDMIEACKPVLASCGLSIFQRWVTVGGTADFIVTRLQHSSGQWSESRSRIRWQPDPNLDQGKNMQNLGSVITYTKKYAYGTMVGLSYGEDDDLQHFAKPGAR